MATEIKKSVHYWQEQEYLMFCPICQKEWVETALMMGGLIQDEKGRLICPCKIHTAEERRKWYNKEIRK